MSQTKRSDLRRDAIPSVPVRTPSKPKRRRKGGAKEPTLSPQEMLDARKDTLIQGKRAEGNEIADRHENMVSYSSRHGFLVLMNWGRAKQLCEMFHLTERTLLLDYNPEVCVAFLLRAPTWLSTGIKGCTEQQIRQLPQGMFADHWDRHRQS